MILRIVWRRDGWDRPQMIVAQAAWPYGEWLCYRKPGSPGMTHYIPGSAVWEITVEAQASDPDPMRKRTLPSVQVELPEP